jgi:hypothetical protein
MSAEMITYGEVFNSFGPNEGKVPTEDEPMRSFLQINTAVGDGLDPEFVRMGCVDAQGATPGVDLDAFLGILREHAVSEVMAIQAFMDGGLGGESGMANAEEVRTHLRSFGESMLGARLDEESWDRVLNTVMMDLTDMTVSMEQWISMARSCARILRLMSVGR